MIFCDRHPFVYVVQKHLYKNVRVRKKKMLEISSRMSYDEVK